MIFCVKFISSSFLDKYKSRVIVKGYLQEEGVDYYETFSPVILPLFVCLFALLSYLDRTFVKLISITHFLNSDPVGKGLVYKLRKALYG